VREGQKREWVREKDIESEGREGGGSRSGGGGGGHEAETRIQNPKKHALTFSVAS
jgi:hypothetical protein